MGEMEFFPKWSSLRNERKVAKKQYTRGAMCHVCHSFKGSKSPHETNYEIEVAAKGQNLYDLRGSADSSKKSIIFETWH